jgi:hypothetical protein
MSKIVPASSLLESDLGGWVARLRAALRLLLLDQDADAVAAHALGAPNERDALRWMLRALGPRYSVARLARGASRSEGVETDAPPLGPQTGAPARAALALALHLGLDAGGALLAEVLQVAPGQIGLLLDEARKAAYPALALACEEHAALAGRYADRTLDTVDAAKLVRHARGCARCRAALESRRWIDQELRARIDAIQARLPSVPLEPVAGMNRVTVPASRLVAVVVLFVTLVLAGSLAVRCSGSNGDVAARGYRAAVPIAVSWVAAAETGAISAR